MTGPLASFRNPPVVGENLVIEPLLNTGQQTVFGQSDVEGNIASFNYLHIGAAQSPGSAQNTSFWIFESYISTTDFNGLRIFPLGDGFPAVYGMNGWIMETVAQGPHGILRDLTLKGGNNLVLAASSGAYWRIENNTGNLVPTNATSADIGMSTSAVQNIFAYGLQLQTYSSGNFGGFEADVVSALGAFLTMLRCTGAVPNPGANKARLYLVNGTTGGTLRLVVKAGAAGAQTTILDNIPQ